MEKYTLADVKVDMAVIKEQLYGLRQDIKELNNKDIETKKRIKTLEHFRTRVLTIGTLLWGLITPIIGMLGYWLKGKV